MKINTPNINIQIQGLLINHLGFTTADLGRNEKILRLAHNSLRDNFVKLIIDVRKDIQGNKIETSPEKIKYFMGGSPKKTERKRRIYTNSRSSR